MEREDRERDREREERDRERRRVIDVNTGVKSDKQKSDTKLMN